jgi:hypothetical protein
VIPGFGSAEIIAFASLLFVVLVTASTLVLVIIMAVRFFKNNRGKDKGDKNG